MNVLHISPNFNYTCGVSRYLLLLFAEFRKRDDIRIFFITNGGDGLDRLSDLNIQPILLNFKTGIHNLFYIYQNLKELKKICLENDIQIIHTHHRYPELLANLLKNQIKVKTITTVHSLVKGLEILSFKSDKILAVSKAVEHNLINNFNVKPNKIIQIYNPFSSVDWNDRVFMQNIRLKLGINNDDRVFLFVGRFHKHKGVDILFDVFSKLSNEFSNLKIILITDINAKLKKNISIPSIIFIEPQKDISTFYRLADYVVLPSRRESFPYSMLEAGYFEKIFIGGNTGGIAEFIENRVNGFLVNPDKNDLETLVRDLMQKPPEYYAYLGKNLRRKVLNLPTPELYTGKLIQIYSQLLNED